MTINSTLINRSDVHDYYADNFPLPYEDDDLNFDITNQTYYDDYIINNNQTFNLTNSDVLSLSSIFSFSSPFSYILLILIVYAILTLILLSLSLYKQRQVEMENFYYGDTQEEIEKAKRCLVWKQLLIEKITKGDMEPLLVEPYSNSDEINSESKAATFPLEIV
ncbi:unnamed protein product [Rotaria sp. Silwood2]|nr:unnamed protein product [Rotaria sp. Silwood2]CAF2727097.1 unnamed protein product [Rotaria sp. Silwood2]CAF2879296.1 unnamed protein product [Rotaria sp. Silwood2]CAF4303562.1 unnamed protein product [Rotaria sp. Silwood2]CAF4407527.1 unnamed protein product [Rotaria sp. Silwood2]